jgi:hypothetical protein
MSNRNRFYFERDTNLRESFVLKGQTPGTSSPPLIVHKVDRVELKNPFVRGSTAEQLNRVVGIKSTTIPASYDLCLPVDAGSSGEFLSTDGTGVLSWIPGTQNFNTSTGVISGGLLTINPDTTKFDISDGNGIIFNTTTFQRTLVSWSGLIAQFTTYIGDETFISLNSLGVPIFSTSLPTNTQIRDQIYLGQIVHLDQVNIIATLDEQMTLLSSTNQIRDFMQAIGELNISGNICSSNSLLTIAKTEGEILKFGGNFTTDINNPHLPISGALDTNLGGGAPNVFAYRWQDGSDRISLTDIEPNEYDDGNGESAPGTVGTNKWTVQRIFTFSIGQMVILQGQFVYNTKEEAIAGIDSEGFIVEPDIAVSSVLISFLAVKGNATDLSLSGDAQFLQAAKFGGSSVGTASGVNGPLSSTDNAITRWDGTSGALIQNSVGILSDTGDLSGIENLTLNPDGALILTETSGGGGTNTITLQAPALSTNIIYTLPIDDGNNTDKLTTDGTGVLSWSSSSGGLPNGYLSGCKLVYNTVSTVDVTAGTAKDGTNAEDISVGALTVIITNSGALGLMTGEVETSNTTFEMYLLHDDTAVNIDSAFLVPEGVTPVEAGYTHFRYIGAVHNSGSNLINFYTGGNGQFRRVLYYESFNTMRVLASGSAITWTTMTGAIDAVNNFCPMGSTAVLLNVFFEADVAQDANIRFRPEGDTGDHTAAYRVQIGEAQDPGSEAYTQITVPLATSRDVQYEGSSSGLDNDVAVMGYDLEL